MFERRNARDADAGQRHHFQAGPAQLTMHHDPVSRHQLIGTGGARGQAVHLPYWTQTFDSTCSHLRIGHDGVTGNPV